MKDCRAEAKAFCQQKRRATNNRLYAPVHTAPLQNDVLGPPIRAIRKPQQLRVQGPESHPTFSTFIPTSQQKAGEAIPVPDGRSRPREVPEGSQDALPRLWGLSRLACWALGKGKIMVSLGDHTRQHQQLQGSRNSANRL